MRTIDDVLTYIRDNSKPGDWQVTRNGCIRTVNKKWNSYAGNDHYQCPLCWLATALGCNPANIRLNYDVITSNIKVPYNEASEIAHAADYQPGTREYDMAMRERLLHACHLPSELVPTEATHVGT
jgi:hypothetical protein